MSDQKNNPLKLIPGGAQANEMKDAVRTFRASLAEQIELQSLVAQIQKAKFDALVAQGFTEAQALELSKTISI